MSCAHKNKALFKAPSFDPLQFWRMQIEERCTDCGAHLRSVKQLEVRKAGLNPLYLPVWSSRAEVLPR